MAQQEKAPPKGPQAEPATEPERGEQPKPEGAKAAETVTALVPQAFILTDDQHRMHHYAAGLQEMPRAHAEHPYARAHGVEAVKAGK